MNSMLELAAAALIGRLTAPAPPTPPPAYSPLDVPGGPVRYPVRYLDDGRDVDVTPAPPARYVEPYFAEDQADAARVDGVMSDDPSDDARARFLAGL